MPILNWLNKDEAVTTSKKCTYRLLEEVPELSYGDADNENLLIQGDNLEALKALIPHYAGKVKCIFIDPPYNTRSAFKHYDDNLEHSQWLCLLYPRLELLRDLLSEDGSIWITIDDNECHYLKVILDEIFGRKNFVTSFIWRKVDSPNDNKVTITPDHEYVLCYAKNESKLELGRKSDISLIDSYRKPDEHSDRPYRDRLLKKNGKSSLRTDRPSMFFGISDPDGNTVYPIHDDGREACWAMGKKGVDALVDNDELIWKKRDSKWVPYTREYAPENPTRPWPTIWNDLHTTRQTKSHLNSLLGADKAFDTPKPENLIARIIEISTKKDDLVLDSFAGTGSTAAAAQKLGRRWITVEIGEHSCSIITPRLKKVINGEDPGGVSELANWQGGGGFRFYKLGEAVFDEYGCLNTGIKFPTLASHIWYLETKTPLGNKVDTPLLGVHNDTAYYLLYNGILGDRRPAGGNVLTSKVLNNLPDIDKHERVVIYGESSRLGEARLKQANITFKQIPYDVGTL
ncbi:MAG: site-specific DNA-methyltransferase [Vibrio sp.]